jgi:hypothetical protein
LKLKKKKGKRKGKKEITKNRQNKKYSKQQNLSAAITCIILPLVKLRSRSA